MRFLGLCMLAALATACSTSGTSIRIGEGPAHAPTDPERIAFLIEAPTRPHTIIALVEGQAATDDYFTKAKTEAAALKAMKEEAAKLGAHAIVLTGKGSAPYGQVGFSNSVGGASLYGNNLSAYSSTVTTSVGWEKITFSGVGIRYTDE